MVTAELPAPEPALLGVEASKSHPSHSARRDTPEGTFLALAVPEVVATRTAVVPRETFTVLCRAGPAGSSLSLVAGKTRAVEIPARLNMAVAERFSVGASAVF